MTITRSTSKVWFVDTQSECVSPGDAIQVKDDWFVIGHGYVASCFVFPDKAEATTALKKFLQSRVEAILKRIEEL